MFTRARLRIAGLYVALLALIVVVVAGSLVLLAARDARRTADQELRLRAQGLADEVLRGQAVATTYRHDDDDDEEHEREEHNRELERQGLLTYVLPISSGVLTPVVESNIPGLPNAVAASDALAAGSGVYTTLPLPDGRVRLYSLPVGSPGAEVAVVQVARSQTFVEGTVRRLLLGLLVSGLAALIAAALAGYWLAGRTLRPIAEAMQQQRRFIADASHELRTPLTVIRGNLEHVRAYPDQPVRAFDDALEDSAAETERLSRLVTGLLTLARADDDRVAVQWSSVDLSALARTLAKTMATPAEAKGLRLQTDIADGVTLQGDPDRLHELLLILLDNAIRYTATGWVRLTLTATDAAATLQVADSGPGIAPEHLPRIFDRFYRTPSARASANAGTGLGLAIARWIAEAHGGRISATSEPGRGSVFTVHLPRHHAKHGPAATT